MYYACIHCSKEFKPNPRVKNQRYCSEKSCQKARRARWQRQKMAADPDYKDNKIRCQKQWHKSRPGYYKDYRDKHPEYVKRNRLLQEIRDIRRRKDKSTDIQVKMLAKLDSLLKPYYSRRGSIFRLIPQSSGMLAKLDSLVVKLIPCKELGSHGYRYPCLQKRTR